MSDRSHKFRKYENVSEYENNVDEMNGMLEIYDREIIEPFGVGDVAGTATNVAVGGVSGIVGISNPLTNWFSELGDTIKYIIIIAIIIVIFVVIFMIAK
jgi:hypothetical protein